MREETRKISFLTDFTRFLVGSLILFPRLYCAISYQVDQT